VLNARKVLDEYGGAFLSDVVGLGKTYMSALLRRAPDQRTLPRYRPRSLARRTQSRLMAERLPDFVGFAGFFANPLANWNPSLIATSRSSPPSSLMNRTFPHRRHAEYEMLAQICRGKRVVLVSATSQYTAPKTS